MNKIFLQLCEQFVGDIPVDEHKFHPVRKFKFDFAFVKQKVAVEVEGGIWQKGGTGHSHPMGIVRDMEKYNLAASMGWRVLRFQPKELLKTSTIELIKKTVTNNN